MFGSRTAWKRIAYVFGGLCLGGALTLSAELRAEEAALPPLSQFQSADNGKNEKKEARPSLGTALPPHLAGVPVLDLGSCKAIALSKQPAIGAAHAGYQAALSRQHGLDTIRVPTFLARDLPIRKHQAAIGVNVAQLEIQRVQIDATYSVTFSYLSAQYAAEQRALLESSREKLLILREGVGYSVKEGDRRSVRKEDVPRVEQYLNVLDSRLEEAIQGEQRAMSALREALGVDPHSPLVIRATGLYRLAPCLVKDQLVADALARRPEIQQAALLNQVHGLEVEAQAIKRLFPTAPTFASGSDLHARPLPAGSYDEQYRPAAVGPDMPVTINGNCSARADVARAYQQRSDSMVEKTKNLITLETEQAYFRYLEASRKLPLLIQAAKNAQAVFDATDAAWRSKERETTPRDWLSAGSQVTELKSQVNLARYQMLVALAGLERATACGYQPGFELAPTTDPPEGKPKDKKEGNELTAPKQGNADTKLGKPDAPDRKQDVWAPQTGPKL